MYLDVFSLGLLVLSAVLASPRFPAYLFCLKYMCMSFLRLIFFLDVVSLNLLVLSPVLVSPTFPAYYLFVQSRYVLLKAYLLSRCI